MNRKYEENDIFLTKDSPRGKVAIVGRCFIRYQNGTRVVDRTRLKVRILKGVREGDIIDISKDYLTKKLQEKFSNGEKED